MNFLYNANFTRKPKYQPRASTSSLEVLMFYKKSIKKQDFLCEEIFQQNCRKKFFKMAHTEKWFVQMDLNTVLEDNKKFCRNGKAYILSHY